MCAQWVAKDPRFLYADSEDSDQTGRMPRLIWVFTGRILILVVLSYRGSIVQTVIKGVVQETFSSQSLVHPLIVIVMTRMLIVSPIYLITIIWIRPFKFVRLSAKVLSINRLIRNRSFFSNTSKVRRH